MKTETAKHTYSVGDIIHVPWGWSMILHEFYQVVEATPKPVVVRHIASNEVGGWPIGTTTPIPNQFIDEDSDFFPAKKRCKVRPDGFIRINSDRSGSLWDGEKKHYDKAD